MFKRCKTCGTTKAKISARGNCWKCAIQNIRDAAEDMRNKKGPHYDKWRQSMKKFSERDLVD